MMSTGQWLTIMRFNVLYEAQAQRQMKTTTAIQISTIDQIRTPYRTIIKSNIFFQSQVKRVTRKQAPK